MDIRVARPRDACRAGLVSLLQQLTFARIAEVQLPTPRAGEPPFLTGSAIELSSPSEAEERLQRRPHGHTGAQRRVETTPRDTDRSGSLREIFFNLRGRSTGHFTIAGANVADPQPASLPLPCVGQVIVGFCVPSTHTRSRYKFEFRQWTHRAAVVALLHRIANFGTQMSVAELRGALRMGWTPSAADALFALARLAVYGDLKLFEDRLRIEAGMGLPMARGNTAAAAAAAGAASSAGPRSSAMVVPSIAQSLCLGTDVNTFVRQCATAFNDFALLEEWDRTVRRVTTPSLISGLSLRHMGSSPTPDDLSDDDNDHDPMDSPVPWKTPLPTGYREPSSPAYDPSSPAYNPTTPAAYRPETAAAVEMYSPSSPAYNPTTPPLYSPTNPGY